MDIDDVPLQLSRERSAIGSKADREIKLTTPEGVGIDDQSIPGMISVLLWSFGPPVSESSSVLRNRHVDADTGVTRQNGYRSRPA